MPRPPRALQCPSAQPDMADAQVLGVVERTEHGPRVAYLNTALPVSAAVLEGIQPAPPLEVIRVAARCETSRCSHFDGAACSLAARIVGALEAVTAHLPPCTIRRSCRWYAERGAAACHRCPQIVTRVDRDAVDPSLMAGVRSP